MADDHRQGDMAALAVLAEPLRRRLYLHVAATPGPVSREEAAIALGIARSVAAFHLDKLAEHGLVDVEYRRPPGRSGPGAGRPAKLYRRSARAVSFAVPERHYDVAASILAQVVERALADGAATRDSARAVARAYGRAVGIEESQERGEGRDAEGEADGMSALARVSTALERRGYEPLVEGDRVTLLNCPFRSVADAHTDLVCSLNEALLDGLVESMGADDIEARLDPAPGRCCVTLVAR